MDKIAVLIPCYNETQTIQAVIDDFKQELPEGTIYVYDNNSTDDTYEIAKAAGVKVKRERETLFGRCFAKLKQNAIC